MVKVRPGCVSCSLAVSAGSVSQSLSAPSMLHASRSSCPSLRKQLRDWSGQVGKGRKNNREKSQLWNMINIRIKMIKQLCSCCYQFFLFRRIRFRVYNNQDDREWHFTVVHDLFFLCNNKVHRATIAYPSLMKSLMENTDNADKLGALPLQNLEDTAKSSCSPLCRSNGIRTLSPVCQLYHVVSCFA